MVLKHCLHINVIDASYVIAFPEKSRTLTVLHCCRSINAARIKLATFQI